MLSPEMTSSMHVLTSKYFLKAFLTEKSLILRDPPVRLRDTKSRIVVVALNLRDALNRAFISFPLDSTFPSSRQIDRFLRSAGHFRAICADREQK